MRPMPPRPGLRSLLRVMGRRLPMTRGTLRVPGLRAQVSVARDRYGIPHIEASTAGDAWYGLGLCHGQDRAFQLEILLRAGRGTLAELLGIAALPIDRLSRIIGFRRLAEAQLGRLDDDVRDTLEAYAAGVNAGRASSPRPHELAMLRAHPTPWHAMDCLSFLGLQSLALGVNWDTELARLSVLLADGPDALASVDPSYAPRLPVVMPVGATAGEALGRLGDDLARLRDVVGGAGASNAWAVAGSRTATGTPILANDPHLAPAVPAPWYLAHLRTPDWAVAGCSFVGGPAFPTGHNGTLAWGITAACTDSSDLFWEEVDFDGRTARGAAGPEPIEIRVEQIDVRGAATVEETVVVTPRGPVITPFLDWSGPALSFAATWLQPTAVRGLLGAPGATDVDAFLAAFDDWPGPSLNVVFADVAGHIGWQIVGRLPRRRAGNGTIPLPAWDPEVGWERDHLPYADLPRCIDPPEGFIASANNAPRADAPDLPLLGVDWLDGFRAARIVEALRERDTWDVEATAELQRDTTSVPWRSLHDLVIGIDVEDEAARIGLELLAAWDGRVGPDSAAATVYELLVAELAAAVAREAAPNGWRWAIGGGYGVAVPRTTFGARIVSQLLAVLADGPAPPRLVGDALAVVVRRLRAEAGPDPSAWTWGRVRPLRLLHPLGAQRPLDRVLNLGPIPIGGDTNTVAQAGILPLDPLGNPAAIANHRTVIDLADPERSRFVVAGGQSGNPLSVHYDDLFTLWERGESVPIAWTPAAVNRAARHRLLLVPEA